MSLTIEQLTRLWGPCAGEQGAGGIAIDRICTDSRADLDGALFVPLVGERFDGHAFLESALAVGGAAAAVAQWDRLSDAEATRLAVRTARPIWRVEDTLLAYQQLARLWRRSLGVPVVGVTGSAGKTTTRELIVAALAPLGRIIASSGNDNNDVGVPKTILKAPPDTAALVVEMAMRGLGEIERLSLCAEPDVSVITNIGTAHIGRLGSRQAIAQAKCEITRGLAPRGVLVIPAGNPLLERSVAAVWQGRVVRVALADELEGFDPATAPPELVGTLQGEGSGAEGMEAAELTLMPGSEAFQAWRGHRSRVPLPGRHNARNWLLALAVAAELGVEPEAVAAVSVRLPEGRNRRVVVAGIDILDETYNASPEAVLASLDLLASLNGRRYAVLGTMLELGERSLELHRQVAAHAAGLGLEGLLIVASGDEARAMAAGAGTLPCLARVDTPEDALPYLLDWLRPGDHLLLKASRGVALERVLPLLQGALATPATGTGPR